MRHLGRLWRLADFVGGTGGSTKPSTDECCRRKSHKSRSETFSFHDFNFGDLYIYHFYTSLNLSGSVTDLEIPKGSLATFAAHITINYLIMCVPKVVY